MTTRRVLVFDSYVDPNQTSLNFSLDYEEWLAGSLEIARSIPQPFYFSDLRKRLAQQPPHVNHWGKLASALMRNWFRRTGNYRRSTIESRNGGLDFEYQYMEGCNA